MSHDVLLGVRYSTSGVSSKIGQIGRPGRWEAPRSIISHETSREKSVFGRRQKVPQKVETRVVFSGGAWGYRGLLSLPLFGFC